ncbi:MAG: phytanoyl-CoA dioxygenase family protein [Kiloniellaceae bacterium]
MALACLAAEAQHAGEKLARQGFALIDGTAVPLTAAVAAFDALRADAEGSQRVGPDHPLVRALLDQPAVRDLAAQALGADAETVRAIAFDQITQLPKSWHQPESEITDSAGGCDLILRWHLDLIGPADGGLRVLPGSHLKGPLAAGEIERLAMETPAMELAVSAGTVLALRPWLVQGSRRRTTRGHRRILQVQLA